MFSSIIDDDALKEVFFISERLIVFDGMDDVFAHIVKTAVALTCADAATIRVFNVQRGRLEIASSFGLSEAFVSQRPLKIGEGITGRVVLLGEPFASNDLATVRQYAYKEVAKAERIKAILSIPLKGKDKCHGCITVYRRKARAFTDHERLVLGIFALQAMEAIEKTQLVNELRRQASYDSLTGTYNKAALLKMTEKHLHLAQRSGLPLSVIFLDVDRFKAFNDNHGHLLGDKLLSDMAATLQRYIRRSDSLARFGGEEFVVLAPHTSKSGAVMLARRLRQAVATTRFMGKKDEPVAVTFSAGVASYPADAGGVAELLANADEAMYGSKASGRDTVTAYGAHRAARSALRPRGGRRLSPVCVTENSAQDAGKTSGRGSRARVMPSPAGRAGQAHEGPKFRQPPGVTSRGHAARLSSPVRAHKAVRRRS